KKKQPARIPTRSRMVSLSLGNGRAIMGWRKGRVQVLRRLASPTRGQTSASHSERSSFLATSSAHQCTFSAVISKPSGSGRPDSLLKWWWGKPPTCSSPVASVSYPPPPGLEEWPLLFRLGPSSQETMFAKPRLTTNKQPGWPEPKPVGKILPPGKERSPSDDA